MMILNHDTSLYGVNPTLHKKRDTALEWTLGFQNQMFEVWSQN